MTLWPLSRLSTHSPNRRILRAAIILGTLSLVARGAAMLKELLVASTFGRADVVDAYLIAYVPAMLVQYLFAGAVAITLVPAYVRVRQRAGLDAADRLASTSTLVAVALLAGSVGALALTASWWLPFIRDGFSPEKLELTRHLAWIVLPVAIVGGFSMCATAILNAGETFAAPALVPVITPLVTMILVRFAAGAWGGYTLAAGMTAGGLLEALVLIGLMRRQGLHVPLRWYGFDPDVRQVLGESAHMTVSYAMSNTGSVDQAMAAMLPAGSVAALVYGNRVPSTLALLGSSSVAAAALPYLSQLVNVNDIRGCAHVLKRWTTIVLGVGLPLILGLVLLSRPIVRLLYQRGAFTPADTTLVSMIQAACAFQVPFFVCSSIFSRFLSSMRRNDLVMRIAGVTLTLNIVLNLVFMKLWGVAGIALSTAIVAALTFVIVAATSIRVIAGGTLTAKSPDDAGRG